MQSKICSNCANSVRCLFQICFELLLFCSCPLDFYAPPASSLQRFALPCVCVQYLSVRLNFASSACGGSGSCKKQYAYTWTWCYTSSWWLLSARWEGRRVTKPEYWTVMIIESLRAILWFAGCRSWRISESLLPLRRSCVVTVLAHSFYQRDLFSLRPRPHTRFLPLRSQARTCSCVCGVNKLLQIQLRSSIRQVNMSVSVLHVKPYFSRICFVQFCSEIQNINCRWNS